MKSEKSGTLFGGPVVLPKGPNQDAAASQSEQSATDGAVAPEDAATSMPAATGATTGPATAAGAAAAPAAPAAPDTGVRQETVGAALAVSAQQENVASKQTRRQLAVVCALAVVCGLAVGIAGGAAATAAGLGSSSSMSSAMHGGPGNMGGQGMQGGMDGQGAMGAPGAAGTQDGAADGTSGSANAVAPDGQMAQPNDGSSSTDGQTPDGGTDESLSDNATTQATGNSSGEVYNA